jgi:RNA polymerase sigma factor (sigma-70 family)
MQELDDIALLRQYAEQNSEEAFAVLVSRHVNKVYSVALRHTRNPHSAEEITQAVFVILAKKSPHLGKKVILSGWLYETSRLTAVTFIRSEIRRARREQEAYMQTLLNETEADVWPQIAPLLDTAMAGLSKMDRHAVVLRFFDGKSMNEVGMASSDATASIARQQGAQVIRVENRQIAATRNAGARQAHGDILFFVDADTLVNAPAIQSALRSIKAGAVGGGCLPQFEGWLPWSWRLGFSVMERWCRWRNAYEPEREKEK